MNKEEILSDLYFFGVPRNLVTELSITPLGDITICCTVRNIIFYFKCNELVEEKVTDLLTSFLKLHFK